MPPRQPVGFHENGVMLHFTCGGAAEELEHFPDRLKLLIAAIIDVITFLVGRV